MGLQKRKLPRIIKSLPKLGQFCQVILKKLTQEEIDLWTKKAPNTDSFSEEDSSHCDDIEQIKESYAGKKRKRLNYFSSTDDEVGFDDDDDEEMLASDKRTRIQPKRSAKKNIPVFTSDTEDDFSENEYFSSHTNKLLIQSTSKESEAVSVDKPEISVNNLTSDSEELVNTPIITSKETPNKSCIKSNELLTKLFRDLNKKIDSNVSLSEQKGASDFVQKSRSTKDLKQCKIEGKKIFRESKSDRINVLNKGTGSINNQALKLQNSIPAKNFCLVNAELIDVVVNEDENNVGKIRIRDLRSLGASDSFIREANLARPRSVQSKPILPNSDLPNVEATVKYLYANHMPSETKEFISEIANFLKEKSYLTENFNTVLEGMQSETKPQDKEVIVNDQLEDIVKKRQECDDKICALFDKLIISFYSDLRSHGKLDLFVTLIYLGFLSILNVFIKITHNRYKKKCLFKNMVSIFIECLRNGNYDNDVVINLFMSKKFHVNCFQLITHIKALQEKDNFFNKAATEPSSHQEIMSIPVRNISFKMEDSKMVIAFSKSLEELECDKNSCNSTSIPSINANCNARTLSDTNSANSPSSSNSVIMINSGVESNPRRCIQDPSCLQSNHRNMASSGSGKLGPNPQEVSTIEPTMSSSVLIQKNVPQNSIKIASNPLGVRCAMVKNTISPPFSNANVQLVQTTSVIQTPTSTHQSSQSTSSSNAKSNPPSIVINSSNITLLNKIRSLKLPDSKNSRVQIVRPIIQPSTQKQVSKPNYDSYSQNSASNTESFQKSVISQSPRLIAPVVTESRKLPPPYSSILVCPSVTSRVENSYVSTPPQSTQAPAESLSLRNLLLSTAPQKTNQPILAHQTLNQSNLQYVPSNPEQIHPVQNNLPPSHPLVSSNISYPVQNSTSTGNPFSVYANESHDLVNTGCEMQQYSGHQPLNTVNNHSLPYNKSNCYEKQRASGSINYINDTQYSNNVQSNQVIVNITQPVINQTNPNQVYWMPSSTVYTPTSSIQPLNNQNQMHYRS